MKNEIILYQPNALTKVEVKVGEETVWLNRQQIAYLFDRDVKTVGKHINNALKEELEGLASVAKFATVQTEGDRTVQRQIEYYNLDVIISVGYRVKSKRGVQFRAWANKLLKEHLLKGYTLNTRIDRVENKVDMLSDKMNEIDLQLNTSLPPKQGVFFDGQIFDAYKLVSDIIRSAQKNIVLVDNYIDDSVLTLLSKKNKKVNCDIFTKNISKKLKLDAEKFNKQYAKLKIHNFDKAHDRFLIIDNADVYHIGASLKDLGKKWFAFTKMDKNSVTELLTSIMEML